MNWVRYLNFRGTLFAGFVYNLTLTLKCNTQLQLHDLGYMLIFATLSDSSCTLVKYLIAASLPTNSAGSGTFCKQCKQYTKFGILSRLDYCNALLVELPALTLTPLQQTMHAAARLMFDISPRDRVTAALKSAHLLPVKQRITENNTINVVHYLIRIRQLN